MVFIGVPEQFRKQIRYGAKMLGEEAITILYGDPYKGKTHEAVNMVYQRLQVEVNASARFVTGEGLLQEVHTAIKGDRAAMSVMAKYMNCSYLVLDDFLATSRQWVSPGIEKINEIIRARLDNHRPLVITTNLSYDDMRNGKLEERVISRLLAGSWNEYVNTPDERRLGRLWNTPADSWSFAVTRLHNICVEQDRCYNTANEWEAMNILATLSRAGLRDVALLPEWQKDYLRELLKAAKQKGIR